MTPRRNNSGTSKRSASVSLRIDETASDVADEQKLPEFVPPASTSASPPAHLLSVLPYLPPPNFHWHLVDPGYCDAIQRSSNKRQRGNAAVYFALPPDCLIDRLYRERDYFAQKHYEVIGKLNDLSRENEASKLIVRHHGSDFNEAKMKHQEKAAMMAEGKAVLAKKNQKALKEAKQELEDANELVKQQTLRTDIWQGRFDEVAELALMALKAGIDSETINEIRYRPTSTGR